MENILRLSVIALLVSAVLFFPLLSPPFCSALRPMSETDLTENSPSLSAGQPDKNEENHLQPINEEQLDVLSPSLVAPEVRTKDPVNSFRNADREIAREFENSICFKRCHNFDQIHPSDKTAKQWRLLIEKDGHAIFSRIPWKTPEQKEKVLDYLLQNAGKSTPGPAGIGVW